MQFHSGHPRQPRVLHFFRRFTDLQLQFCLFPPQGKYSTLLVVVAGIIFQTIKMLPETAVVWLVLFNTELLSAAGAELGQGSRDGKLFRFTVFILSDILYNHCLFQHFFFDPVS